MSIDYGPSSGIQPGGDIFPARIVNRGTPLTDSSGTWTPYGFEECRQDSNVLGYPDAQRGRTGDASRSPPLNPAVPARIVNSTQAEPVFNIGDFVWVRLRGVHKEVQGYLYDILGLVSGATSPAPTIPCDFVTPGANGWPAVIYLWFPAMDIIPPASAGCQDISYPLSGFVAPLVSPFPFAHWGINWTKITPTQCFRATVACDSHQLRLTVNLGVPTIAGLCPDGICVVSFTALIGIASVPFNYSGLGHFPRQLVAPGGPQCGDCNDANFQWALSDTHP